MGSYWPEFLTIVVAHGLAVASPGPDFAIVLRQSLRHGRRTALWTSVGIGCGLSVHVTYCLLGLGLFLQKSAVALATVKWLGAAYLAWVGVEALRSRPRSGDLDLSTGETAPTARAAWTTGFLVNVTNIKAALFFISLFPLAVSVTTPQWIQAGYGAWMVVTTALWFSFVSVVFTREEVRRSFLRHGHWIDRALGLVFLGFAASLAFATLK
jgi:RhtB (resistance to homoserine/threonine) family protein